MSVCATWMAIGSTCPIICTKHWLNNKFQSVSIFNIILVVLAHTRRIRSFEPLVAKLGLTKTQEFSKPPFWFIYKGSEFQAFIIPELYLATVWGYCKSPDIWFVSWATFGLCRTWQVSDSGELRTKLLGLLILLLSLQGSSVGGRGRD